MSNRSGDFISNKSPRESGDDSEDESEILEESPCGRWLKRREEVEQRDIPGIDGAYLAMDTEEGVEVVWNEVQFSERKNLKYQEESIEEAFESLTLLDHPNIVKFHRYWTDTYNDRPRIIFITEYMSSGSLKQFLKRTKRNVKRLPFPAWRRWCTQILSALSYLHSCEPPIIHGNLTCDTIFIQHNGLVKIGSVAPDAINLHVKTFRENMKNLHFLAPEYGSNVLSPAIDIFSFGMCALEMAALEIHENGDNIVSEAEILRATESIENEQQKDFILKCLNPDPHKRPSARELLFHPLLFEVHPLKLLSADCLVTSNRKKTHFSETIIDELMQDMPEKTLAITKKCGEVINFKISDVPAAEKLEKFVEDVKNGIYPLTAYPSKYPPLLRNRAISPAEKAIKSAAALEPVDIESRRIVNMMCSVKTKERSNDLLMTILLRMDDKMNRQLTCQVSQDDSANLLSHELVHLGFIHEEDREKIAALIEDTLRSSFAKQHLLLSALHPQISTEEIHKQQINNNSDRSWVVADSSLPKSNSKPDLKNQIVQQSSKTGTSSNTTSPPATSSNAVNFESTGIPHRSSVDETGTGSF